ncbi:MAG: hypothetical protein PHE83_02070 [Opitutaceae bacterium]|nr:hypothetical protein [Opitutaceae bacterium]
MWDWLFQFIDPLERRAIPYALVGSVASSIYGEPRATNDLDVVIQIGANDARRLIAAFSPDRFYVPPEEVVLAEIARAHGAHLNVIALDSMTKADLYPLPVEQQDWFLRRRALAVNERQVWLAAPEVVILHKLLFHREGGGEKHLRDVRVMMATLGSELDRPWLQAEAARLGLALPPEATAAS